MKKAILAIRNCEADVRWPAYSRELHDVIPGRHPVQPSSNIVVIDGNYMLVDRGPFRGMPALFDLRIYVDSPAAVIISTLMDRHIVGGKDETMAKEWVKKIDLPNARLAESTKPLADLIIERSSDGEMVGLTWNKTAERKPETV
jgi:pantothenate kinase